MVPPLVVGTDGSDASLRAVDWAADDAARRQVPLRVVHASLWTRQGGQAPPAVEDIAASAVERAASRHPGLAVTAEVLADDPVEALIGDYRHILAVVVGTRGRGELADLLLGSVSLSVAARARCPVVVVRDGRAHADRGIVVGVAGSDRDATAVRFALEEAALRGCGVTAVHAWMLPFIEAPTAHTGQLDDARRSRALQAEGRLEDALRKPSAEFPDVVVHRVVFEGHARTALLGASRGADLLVAGARRRDATVGMQLGTVNHALLHHAPCPIAIVPHQ